MRKNLTLTILFLLSICKYAHGQNGVVALNFHFYPPMSGNLQEHINEAYSMVCEVNNNYRDNGVAISFYVGSIAQISGQRNNQTAVAFGINIWMDGLASGNNAAGINLLVPSSTELTHEIGHFLGLSHTNISHGGCTNQQFLPANLQACSTNPNGGFGGGFDCINDTPDPIPLYSGNPTGNWMDNGSPAGPASIFSTCQKEFIYYKLNYFNGPLANWPIYPSTQNPYWNILNFNSNYTVPLEKLNIYDGEWNAEISFTYGLIPCSAQSPDYVEMEVHYLCAGRDDFDRHIVTDLATTVAIRNCHAITYIKYIYHYGSYTFTKIINYRTQGLSWVDEISCPCSSPASRGIDERNLWNSSTITDDNIKISSENILSYNNARFNKFEIYDMTGKKIISGLMIEGKSTIPLHEFNSGVYIFRAINLKGETMSTKFIKF